MDEAIFHYGFKDIVNYAFHKKLRPTKAASPKLAAFNLLGKDWFGKKPAHKSQKSGAYSLIGKPLNRLDIPDKIAGRTTYGIDVKVPKLLHAVILRNPGIRGDVGRIKSYGPDPQNSGTTLSEQAFKERFRVKHIFPLAKKDGLIFRGGIVVVAETFWHAEQAAKNLQVSWPASPVRFTEGGYRDSQVKAMRQHGKKVKHINNPDTGTMKQVSSTYWMPAYPHQTMEPLNATVVYNDTPPAGMTKLTVYTGTQLELFDIVRPVRDL